MHVGFEIDTTGTEMRNRTNGLPEPLMVPDQSNAAVAQMVEHVIRK